MAKSKPSKKNQTAGYFDIIRGSVPRKPRWPDSHLFELKRTKKIQGRLCKPGWYYWDEAEQLGGGPYFTREVALANLNEYARSLDESATPNKPRLLREEFTYTYNANGYWLMFRGEPIGGASVRLPRRKPLRGRQAENNRKGNRESAEATIQSILAGNGPAYMLKAVQEIRSRHVQQKIVWGLHGHLSRGSEEPVAPLRTVASFQTSHDRFADMTKSQLLGAALRLESALLLVATGIWRNAEMNTCGLAGGAVVVHAVEAALGIKTPASKDAGLK